MKNIKYLIIDVDGTLTDGGIYYDETGNELKKFCTKDAAGFFAAHKAGIKIIILTGRECKATKRRMEDLKVEYLYQNIKDKTAFLQDFMENKNLSKQEIGYIGDDLNDLAPMRLVGFVGCPKDSCPEVLEISNYISPLGGGHGAVRDVIEHLLRESGEWSEIISSVYKSGI